MPEYLFVDHTTKKEWKQWMGIQEADDYLSANPNVERLVHGCPRIVRGINTFGHKKKPDTEFRHRLKQIKKNNPGSGMNVP